VLNELVNYVVFESVLIHPRSNIFGSPGADFGIVQVGNGKSDVVVLPLWDDCFWGSFSERGRMAERSFFWK
jgi:hypothetical protein